MQRIVLTIAGELFAPAVSLALLRRTPEGLTPIRADQVQVGDRVLFDISEAGSEDRRAVEGVVEAIGLMAPKTGHA